MTKQKLPTELKALVNQTLKLLGEASAVVYGDSTFKEVEKIRQEYKAVRSSAAKNVLSQHYKTNKRLSGKSPEHLREIAHIFAASLELINACENAYRSFRLARQEAIKTTESKLDPVIFVLTAHPTEARNSGVIKLLDQISNILICKLRDKNLTSMKQKELFHLIVLLCKTPISKSKSPTVQDEAEYIYTTLLKPSNVEVLCDYAEANQPVYIRTWVGGDKDGHPGIDEKVMLTSLTQSRAHLIPFAHDLVLNCFKQVSFIDEQAGSLSPLKKELKALKDIVLSLKKLSLGDGKKIAELNNKIENCIQNYKLSMGVASPELARLQSLLKVFPGLVVPLELREDSAVIKEALVDAKLFIAKMLVALRQVANGGEVIWYVRGFVISMCESFQDYKNACQLLELNLKSLDLPVVPLYETRAALENSSIISKQILEDKSVSLAISKKWDNKLEIMLGYSDSAKESGALFSRVMIQKTLQNLEKLIISKGIIPIFFHGSGGSVARGGGSLNHQLSWWPKSARLRYKATIQGEMIHRTFSTPEIFKRQVEKIRASIADVKANRTSSELRKVIEGFANSVRLQYLSRVEDEDFMKMVQLATPYPFLDNLKIGSRPSKRKSGLNLKSLRAIPWVLCWTQTRIHFPVWWGIGTAWSELSKEEKIKLKKAFKETSMMSSFVTVLAFTLAKVDFSVWAYFLESSDLSKDEAKKHLDNFQKEFNLVKKFVSEITNQNKLIWLRPWLEESISLRTTMIHPLSLLEVHALKSKDISLLRETITGVASGMLTTG